MSFGVLFLNNHHPHVPGVRSTADSTSQGRVQGSLVPTGDDGILKGRSWEQRVINIQDRGAGHTTE